MSDFNQQIRQHYEQQKLSPAKVDALLAAGGSASQPRPLATRWPWLVAACCVFGVIVFAALQRSKNAAEPGRIVLGEAMETVRAHFSRPDYELDALSGDPAVLRAQLIAAGAPADFELPAAVASLPSYGCKVFEVRGQKIYLMCFFLEPGTGRASGEPAMRQMTVIGADGSMMKKDRPLVHLVVADRSAFSDAPVVGGWVSVPFADRWSVRARSAAGRVVMLATQSVGPEVDTLLGAL